MIVSFRLTIVVSLPARRSWTLTVAGTFPKRLRNCPPVPFRPTVTVTVCPPGTLTFFRPTTTASFVLPFPAARMVTTLPPPIVWTVVTVSVKWQYFLKGAAHQTMLLTPLPLGVGLLLPEERASVAVTASLEAIATMHDFGPEQPAPAQPANAEPDLTRGVTVTREPWPNIAEHVLGQEMAAGLLVTDPEPLPFTLTLSARGITKFAVTD